MDSLEILLVSTIILILIVYWKNKPTYKKLPPGPIRWPIIGSLPQLLLTNFKCPHLQLASIAKKYGGIMSIGFGVHYAVVLSSFEQIKDILRRPETNVERYRFQFNEQRSNGKNLGMIWAGGQLWKEQKRFTLRSFREFGIGKTDSRFGESMREELDLLFSDVLKESEKQGGIWSVDRERFAIVAINVIWSMLGGFRFEPESENIKRMIQLNTEIFEAIGLKSPLILFPFLKIFGNMSGYNRQREVFQKAQLFIEKLIDEARQRGEGRFEHENFIEVYLQKIEKDKGEGQAISYATEEQLAATLFDLFLAGTDTISSGMNWLLLHLARNQEVQAKARREVLKYVTNGMIGVTLDAVSRMTYVRACVLESLRISPLAPMPPMRLVTQHIKYEDYIIPKGTSLIFNFYPVLHDPTFWGDPGMFRPERFFNSSKLDHEKLDRVCVFGFGQRKCPAETIAMDLLCMFLATIVTKFSFDVIKGKEPSIEPVVLGLGIVSHPFSVVLTSLD